MNLKCSSWFHVLLSVFVLQSTPYYVCSSMVTYLSILTRETSAQEVRYGSMHLPLDMRMLRNNIQWSSKPEGYVSWPCLKRSLDMCKVVWVEEGGEDATVTVSL